MLEANAAQEISCDGRDAHPDCGTHNMMVVGQKMIFLSHLPMFHAEHRFQVIFEATFARDSKNLDGIYAQDRKDHAETKMYTVAPSEKFVLAQLFSADERIPPRRAFHAGVFRGHFERGGVPIKGLTDIDVEIIRVVYAMELQPNARKSDALEYILFGSGQEFFLAHRLTRAPDFDHIVAVKMDAHSFTEGELSRGVLVRIPNRENSAAQRLRAEETTAAEGHVTGAHQFLPLQLHVGIEYYFEEGELSVPATFDQTSLENAAGF
jgi:hypothetical protein